MTVGEKIQYYRKLSGLSQDELGQKLLVSRQTVSLWENGQTVPTIDNLLRLKEIFGVTVDELLGESGNENAQTAENADEPEPSEQYSYRLSQENVNSMKKYFFGKITRTMFLSVLAIALICLVFGLLHSPVEEPFISFSVFVAFITAILLGVYFATKGIINKNWKNQEAGFLDSVHEYKLYNSYMTVSVYQNGELHGMVRLYYDKIDKIHDLGDLRLIESEKQYYPVGSGDFQNSAYFSQFISINPKKMVNEEKASKWKALSTLFIILSVFSVILVIPSVIAIVAMNYTNEGVEALSVKLTFLLAVFPVSSVIFGIVALCKKVKAKKNIIIGLICVLLVCSLSAIFGISKSQLDEGLILTFENETGYDLPEPVAINPGDEAGGFAAIYDIAEDDEQVGWSCSFETDSESVKKFVRKISDDSNWLTEKPENYDRIFGLDTDSEKSGYYLAFNTETGEYNTVPSEDGIYKFYNVSFDEESNMFFIQEFYADITAD